MISWTFIIDELIQIKEMKKRLKKPKITLIEVLKKDMSIKEVMESMILDRIEWQEKIHVTDLD